MLGMPRKSFVIRRNPGCGEFFVVELDKFLLSKHGQKLKWCSLAWNIEVFQFLSGCGNALGLGFPEVDKPVYRV